MYRKQSPKSRLVKINFDPEAHKTYMKRTSGIVRTGGIILNIAMLGNIIGVAISNNRYSNWGVPNDMRIFNSVFAGTIAFSLIVTLTFLLLTLKTYVKGASKSELGASRIRRFFIFFTMAYSYLAALEIYATS